MPPYSDLLSQLHAAIAERERIERELLEFEAAEHREPDGIEAVLRGLTADHEQDLAAAEEQLLEDRQTLEDQMREKTAEIRADFTRESADVQSDFEEKLALAERKYDEDCWLLTSVLDDESDSNPKYQLEKLKPQLEKTGERLAENLEELRQIAERTDAAVAHVEYRIGFDPEPRPQPETRDEAFKQFTEALDRVRLQSLRVPGDFALALLKPWTVSGIGLGLWLVLSAVAFFGGEPAWLKFSSRWGAEWALTSLGAGFGLMCIVLLVIYEIAVRRVASLTDPLRQDLADCQRLHQAWTRLASADLQKAEAAYEGRHASITERRHKSMRQFAKVRDERIADLTALREEELRRITHDRDAALRESSRTLHQQLQALESDHQAAVHAKTAAFEAERDRLTRERDRLQAEQTTRRHDLWERLIGGWNAAVAKLSKASEQLTRESRGHAPAWEELLGPGWKPAESLPTEVRIGDYLVPVPAVSEELPRNPRLRSEASVVPLPAVLKFPETSLLLEADGTGKPAAVAILQVAMLRILTQFPPGQVRFTILDPVGLGENFAAFMHLADFDELLISSRIWTDPSHIDRQLALLTEHLENVFQKYLRNEFETIEDYNRHAGEVAEPYHFLVVANFPNGFSERAAQRLTSIATSGARCGVHTLISVDLRQPTPRGFELSELETAAKNVLAWSDVGWVQRPTAAQTHRWGDQPRGGSAPLARLDPPYDDGTRNVPAAFDLPLVPDPPPSAPQMAAIVRKVGEFSRNVRRVEVPFHRIVPREEAYWTQDSRSMVEVPLGRAGATKLQHLRLGPGTSQHVLVAGKTGSGKSTLLHVIVTNLAVRYSPDEVEFYLVDFKKGVEFKTYAAHQLPHARVISIESDREFAVSTLERLDAILKERGDLFRQEEVQDIAAFRNARPDVPMPRILFIVDEFQEFFVEDDRYSQTAALLLDRLVRQGRAFGMHVLLGSQTLGGAYSLARTTLGQMAVRIALQCSEADAHLILSEDNTAARLLTRPGEALYNDANGLVEGNSPFQVAWLDDAQRDGFLEHVRRLAADSGRRWPEPIVFEGNVPANPVRNRAFRDLLAPTASTGEVEEPRAWLGEAVAITGPTEVLFSRRSGANLLIVGQESVAAHGILSASLTALAMQSGEDPERPHVTLLCGDSDSAIQKRWSRLVDALGQRVRIAGMNDGGTIVAELAAEVVRRQEEGTGGPSLFLVLDNLSRFRDLRKGDDDFGFSGFGEEQKGASPGKLFTDLLKDGPAVGVHTIVWCDSYNNVDRWFNRQTLREFEMRVAFPMSAADSSNLIDSPAASRLGTNRALLYSDERGTVEKFRPYGPPGEDWLSLLRPGAPENIEDWVVT